jgi:hypothetical protein
VGLPINLKVRALKALARFGLPTIVSQGGTQQGRPVPDIINTATRKGIGPNGQQKEELYT